MSSNGARKLNPNSPWQKEVDASTTDQVDRLCIGVTDSMQPQDVLRLATEQGFGHVIQRKGLEFDKEIKSAERLINAPESFFTFPIASIFSPDDLTAEAESKVIAAQAKFNSSHQKRDILKIFSKAMESKGVSQTMNDDITSVADEMYTNAVFNAPFVSSGSKFNPGVSRQDQEVILEVGKQGLLVLAHDEKRIMIACQDPYGSLNLDGYLGKIKATYERGAAATMNFGSGGAGIGSYIIYNTCVSFYVGVKAGRTSIICCVLPLGMSNRKRALMPKHLHWIHLEEE